LSVSTQLLAARAWNGLRYSVGGGQLARREAAPPGQVAEHADLGEAQPAGRPLGLQPPRQPQDPAPQPSRLIVHDHTLSLHKSALTTRAGA